jgi:LysM repeat protein
MKMKAQKLGLVLGMNMAVACLVMQGCKAVKPEKDLPPPETTTIGSPAAPAPTVTEIDAEPAAPAPGVPGAGGVQQETMPPPPATRTVAKLPPPPAPPKKPATASTAPAAGATPSAAPVVHVVKRGEILSGISKKYNVKLSAIVAANPGIDPNRILIGQKLNIPGSAAAPKSNVMLASAPAKDASHAAANTTAPVKVKPAFKPYKGPTKEYVVKSGDSLGKIALASGISIRALKEMNGLTKDAVRPGQKLKIPAEKQVAQKPEAEKKAPAADAKKPAEKPAQAPAAEAAAAAPAPAAEAKKDAAAEKKDAAAAPAAEQKPAETAAAEKPAEPAAPAAEQKPAGNTYVVKEGDDIVSISIAWGISPSQLMNANDLKENEPLKPGQELKLPPNARQTVQ